MAEKIIRDPVHDVIAFRTDRPADSLLFRLINAAEFQRLRRVRQLGMASLAYPGADHSRYSHSLGVMQTARRMIEQLRRSVNIDEAEETVCLAGCLLHDLGHGPFSHVFERVSGISHEGLTRRILLDPEAEVHRLLAGHDATLPQRVVDLLSGKATVRPLFCDILASQLDADRFDYLLRDNLMTGSRYGAFDLNWLLHALAVHEPSGRLAVTWKGVSAVEAYLQARYHMYRNVYFHKVVRAAEGMVKLALQRAKRLAVQERLAWPPPESVVHKALMGRRFTIEEFTELDDVSVTHCFKVWQASDDAPLARLCRGLLYRRVYKTIDLTQRGREPAEFKKLSEAAAQAVASAGGEPAYDVFADEPSETPYEAHRQEPCADEAEILILGRDGVLTPFTAISPMTEALNLQLMFRRLHVAPEYPDVVEAAVRNRVSP
ncbi:MAG TPA: HD domain-containing protein [Tepidisphaeraceae bacterium]|nr:HD domain-containing protein [Tepidisphaeraceae bacterium]